MSAPGIVKVVVKLPYAEYALLKRFKGASDGEKILALVMMANRRLTAAQDEAAKQVEERQKEAKPGLAQRVKKALRLA